jgi:VWFA-related protein
MPLRARVWLGRGALPLALLLWGLYPAPPMNAQEAATPEISTQEEAPITIHAWTNEVLVRVVVRDPDGKAVPNLTKDDFRLLDNGKPQVIGQFSVERAATPEAARAVKTARPAAGKAPEQAEAPAAPPNRFVAFYFDDTFMSFEDIVRTRDAATRYLNSSFTPGDRIALYTSSAEDTLEFTSDRSKLEAALAKLRPHPLAPEETIRRPLISEYEAYLIDVQQEKDALDLAVAKVKTILCGQAVLPGNAPAGANVNTCAGDPTEYAKSEARQIWERARFSVNRSLEGLLALVRRLSVMPGQRMIVWVSPGFLGMDQDNQLTSLSDLALRARVVINALDSRGLWTRIPGGDASQPSADMNGTRATGRYAALEDAWAQTAQESDSAVLDAAAAATGGVFFHDSNDYDSGFRKVGGLPEVAYLLSFSPQNLKYDGKYHKLTVELVNGRGLSLQARKGYFAPTEAPNSEREAQAAVEDEVFSRDDRNDLPLQIQTQFFMTDQMDGQLAVMARVDLHGARLEKEQQVNVDKLHFVTALFDENGNFLEGKSRIINLRLKDATLSKLMAGTGTIQTAWHFKVKPGTYVVREVVRDAGSGGIAAASRTVEIPFP